MRETLRVVVFTLLLSVTSSANAESYRWWRLPSGKIVVVYEQQPKPKPKPKPDAWELNRRRYFQSRYGYRPW